MNIICSTKSSHTCTGNDTLTARGLDENYFEFKPTHKIWMYGNRQPKILGTDDAIWKRPQAHPLYREGSQG